MSLRARLRTVLTVLLLSSASPLSAQTIRGQLLDIETDQPIDLGLVIMLTEAGDSVASALTSPEGRFAIRSPEPGSFVLLGSAFGYREAPAGVFELGEGGEMTVDFRLRPEPVTVDGVRVDVEGLDFDHPLVRNGFVRRFQRGLGHFITPHEVQNSPARETASLFQTVPGMIIRDNYGGGDVLMRSVTGPCFPTLFVDGIKVGYGEAPLSLSSLIPLAAVEAVEVYRRPAEIPVEYAVTQGGARPGFGRGACGVLVFWTKGGGTGVATEQHRGPSSQPGADPARSGQRATLLPATKEGSPPSAGERIRMSLEPALAASLGLEPVWEATFLGVREEEFVAMDLASGGPVAVPMQAVERLQVERDRPFRYAVRRGLIAGTAFGVGSWLALRTLCNDPCSSSSEITLSSALIGLFGGLLVGSQGPGTQWMEAPLPESTDRSSRPRAAGGGS